MRLTEPLALVLLAALPGCAHAPAAESEPVEIEAPAAPADGLVDLGDGESELRAAFRRTADQARLVVILSPT